MNGEPGSHRTGTDRTEEDRHWERIDRGRDVARRMQAEEKQLDIIKDVLPQLGPDQRNMLGERIDDAVQDAVVEYLEERDK